MVAACAGALITKRYFVDSKHVNEAQSNLTAYRYAAGMDFSKTVGIGVKAYGSSNEMNAMRSAFRQWISDEEISTTGGNTIERLTSGRVSTKGWTLWCKARHEHGILANRA